MLVLRLIPSDVVQRLLLRRGIVQRPLRQMLEQNDPVPNLCVRVHRSHNAMERLFFYGMPQQGLHVRTMCAEISEPGASLHALLDQKRTQVHNLQREPSTEYAKVHALV